ncbi:MAG: SAM-dependent methyltransferase [Alphaproteobacteria bacterium]|nr:SAM-dependent methyltransferase [Alphaproteobacteria bacterium]
MPPLDRLIRTLISTQGAISLAAYMELALQHPDHGYYRVRNPVGRAGDFITAPEISQMFGEMIGVWCAETWRILGKPTPFALIELGPGRGAMMQDILRATAHVEGFHAAKNLCLIDSNQLLREEQSAKLRAHAPNHFDDLAQIPPMPSLILANEFFDALPTRAFAKTFRGWAEHMVTIENDALTLALRPLEEAEHALIPPTEHDALPGTVIEFSPQAQSLMRDLSRRLAAQTGAMLIIDYGYTAPPHAPTVQAVSNHAFANIFDRPGEVDLTAHVDFAALRDISLNAGLRASPIIGQGEFLKNLGIDLRAETLKRHATPAQSAEIATALCRLTDDAQMGSLFKVMEINFSRTP